MSRDRMARIQAQLVRALHPQQMELRDDSAQHAGHAGARDGRGHFHLTIVSEAFRGQSAVQRHRQVYAALGTLMQTDIHALGISAAAPEETS